VTRVYIKSEQHETIGERKVRVVHDSKSTLWQKPSGENSTDMATREDGNG